MGLKHYKTRTGTYLHVLNGDGKCSMLSHLRALNRRLEMRLVDAGINTVFQNEPSDHPPVLSQVDAKKLVGG